MANKIGKTLSRLIKEHAYLAGSLPAIQKEAEEFQSRLEASIEKLSKGNSRLVELGKQITELSAIDPADIRVIKAKPRKMQGDHGRLRRELVQVLQQHDEPVESGELVQYIVNLFSYPFDTPSQKRLARNAINGPLNLFKKRGVVIRHPSLDGSSQGRWQWVKSAEDDQALNINSV
ncbi:MAG: hypothetical protein ACXWTR_03040 [Methylotenera sp.]